MSDVFKYVDSFIKKDESYIHEETDKLVHKEIIIYGDGHFVEGSKPTDSEIQIWEEENIDKLRQYLNENPDIDYLHIYNEVVVSSSDDKQWAVNTTAEAWAKNKENSSETPTDNPEEKKDDNTGATKGGTSGKTQTKTVDANDYISKYLGPTCVAASREGGSPQIPPSTIIGCALQRGGLSLETTADFNVFGLAYDSKYSKKKGTGGLAGYNNLKEAVGCFVSKLHSSDFAEPNKILKEKVSDDSEADKKNYTGMMITVLLKDKGESNIKTFHTGVSDMIKKYSLYNFDDPNASTTVDEKVQSQADAAQGKLIAATKNTHEGGGFKRVQVGPETVTLTKLPLGKTNPCEPIYPDLITVSDTVPEWVFREAIAQMNARAEAAADIAAINEGDSSTKKERAVEDAQRNFDILKDTCFAQWMADNDYKFDGKDVEFYNACQQKYAEEAKKDDGAKFYNGVYYGGKESKKKEIMKAEEMINKAKNALTKAADEKKNKESMAKDSKNPDSNKEGSSDVSK